MVNHVGIVLYDNKNKILLQHRDDKIGIWNPNAWAFFGGGVENNESFDEAVIRETKEELDYDLTNYTFLATYFNEPPDIVNHYIKKISEKEKKYLVLGEGQDWGWFSLDEADSLNWNEGRIEWNFVKKYLKKHFNN